MSASTTMEVATTLAITWMEVTHVPAIIGYLLKDNGQTCKGKYLLTIRYSST